MRNYYIPSTLYAYCMSDSKNYKKIDKFLNRYKHKKSSYNKYNRAIQLYLTVHPNINPETYLIDIRRLSRDKELDHLEQIKDDLEKYQPYLEKNYSPNTVKLYMSSIRQLLQYYDCEPRDKVWKELKRIRNEEGNVFYDIAPKDTQIKEILVNANALDTAFSLLLITTGIRPASALDIDEKQDLHLDEQPPRINITAPNNGNKKKRHFIYTTEECKEHILIWIKQKKQYIERTRKISNLPIKYEESTKLFPFAYETMSKHWNDLLKKAGLNEVITNAHGKKQHLYHLYTLRQFFRSYLNNKDLAELLIGHTDMSNYYFNKNEEDIKKDYLEYSKNLYILSKPTITKKPANTRIRWCGMERQKVPLKKGDVTK